MNFRLRLVGLIALVGAPIASSLAIPNAAEAFSAPFESGDVSCRMTDFDTNYNIIISHQVYDDYGCEAFGKNEKQFVYSHTCGTCDESQPVIQETDLTYATKHTGCIQLEYWGNSPYGYDYLPNNYCLESTSDGPVETGIMLCFFYLESENEDIFFPRQDEGDNSVECDEITITDHSPFVRYKASDLPAAWGTVHEDTWPYPGDNDSDDRVDLTRCDNFTHFLELTNHTADACSHMGEPINASTKSITTAHESLHTLPRLHGKIIPNPEPGVAPNHQTYSILAGDALKTNNGVSDCTAGPQITWTEDTRQMYGMAVPSHCVNGGIGSVVHKVGRGFASVVGYDFTRKIGEVVAISDSHDLALIEYYWVDCSDINCVEYEIRGTPSIRTGTGPIWSQFTFLSGTYSWSDPLESVGKTFSGYGSKNNSSFTGEFQFQPPPYPDEDGVLILEASAAPAGGDSGGPIWRPTGSSAGSSLIAGMHTSTEVSSLEEANRSGFMKSDTILSWVQSKKGPTARFVTFST